MNDHPEYNFVYEPTIRPPAHEGFVRPTCRKLTNGLTTSLICPIGLEEADRKPNTLYMRRCCRDPYTIMEATIVLAMAPPLSRSHVRFTPAVADFYCIFYHARFTDS